MSRTNLKQQLMREQLQHQERKEALQRQQQQQQSIQRGSRVITSHSSSFGGQFNGGAGESATQMIKLSESKSSNYLSSEGIEDRFNNNMTPTTPSTPSTPTPIGTIMNHNPLNNGPGSPFPLSPDSPHSRPRSSASEIDEIWEDVNRTLALELLDGNNGGSAGGGDSCSMGGHGGGGATSNSIHILHHNQSHHHHHHKMDSIASTLPADMGYFFNPHHGLEDSQQSSSNRSEPKMSTSCPPLSSDPEFNAWERERKKKDAHNKIERRRRYNINDRIKELSTLLPTQDETRYYDLVKDMKQNKGTILKASVDFLRSLKRDVTRIPELERQKRELEMENRKMSQKIQQLEQDLRRHSLIGGNGGRNLYKSDGSTSKSIHLMMGQQQQQQASHHQQQSHQGTPPQQQHHHQQAMQQTHHHLLHNQENDYWINGSVDLGEERHHHLSNAMMTTENDLVDNNNDIYGSRMHHSHPMVKQEYNISPSQSSSGLGSLSSPSSLNSTFLPLAQMMIEEHKDPILGGTTPVKGELLSPQVMDVCD